MYVYCTVYIKVTQYMCLHIAWLTQEVWVHSHWIFSDYEVSVGKKNMNADCDLLINMFKQ